MSRQNQYLKAMGMHNLAFYLSNLPGCIVEKIRFDLSRPASPETLKEWETQNYIKLPTDFKQFLAICNGVSFDWGWCIGESSGSGRLTINSIENFIRFDRENHPNTFLLAECANFGSVVITLGQEVDQVEILFYDNQYKDFSLISRSFSCYFRLMIACLGINGWQLGYTKRGWPMSTFDWIYFYAPEIAKVINAGPH